MANTFKRMLAVLCATMMLLVMCPVGAFPVIAATSGGYTYTVENGQATITDYNDGMMNLTIPDTLDGYIVTAIGEDAFRACTNLQHVTIPDSVRSMGKSAFRGCYNLKSVTFDGGLTTIESEAFYNCSSLKVVELPSSVRNVNDYAFYGCTALTTVYYSGASKEAVTIGSSNSRLVDAAWYCDCVGFGSYDQYEPYAVYSNGFYYVRHRDNTLSATDYFFSYYQGETGRCYFPSSVDGYPLTRLGGSLLKNINKSEYFRISGGITIPSSITRIDSGTFSTWTKFGSVRISDLAAWCAIDFGDAAASPFCSGAPLYINNERVTDLVIPDGVTSIADYAFLNCTSIESVTIPASVTSIGASAFAGCTALKSVTMTDNVTAIGTNAFGGCTALESVTLSSGVTAIEDGTFANCTTLKTFVIPHSVKTIGGTAFKDCAELKTVTFANGVTTIGESAFKGCAALETLYYIGTEEQAQNIIIGENNDDLLNAEWHYEGLSTCEQDGVRYALNADMTAQVIGCSGTATAVVISSQVNGYRVTSIADQAFIGNTVIESVFIPDSVTYIGDSAFKNCSSLASITLPDTVEMICRSAFYNTAYFNDIANWENEKMLYIGKHLIDAKTDIAGEYVIRKDTKSLAKFALKDCKKLTSVVIPDGITCISEGAFYDCQALVSVSVPQSITYIEERAFMNCYALETIMIPVGVTNIDVNAFHLCAALKTVYYGGTEEQRASLAIGNSNTKLTNATWYYETMAVIEQDGMTFMIRTDETASIAKYSGEAATLVIPDTVVGYPVTDVVSGAFADCTTLQSVILPRGVTAIGNKAFSGCTALQSIALPEDLRSIGQRAFYGCTALVDLSLPEDLTTIGYQAFYKCSALAEVTIPGGVVTVGEAAFADCVNLKTATLCDGVTAIGAAAFNNCAALETITLPVSVTTIGENAFYNCSALKDVYYDGTKEQKNAITVGNYNEALTDAAWHCCDDVPEGLEYSIDGGKVTIMSYRGSDAAIVIPSVIEGYPVTSICVQAFYYCMNLQSVVIPDSVKEIGDQAFAYCKSLQSITLGSGVQSIGKYVFRGCESLEAFKVDEDNAAYAVVDGVLFNKKKTVLVQYPPRKAGVMYTVPSTVKTIGEQAFEYCRMLESITVPSNVTSIAVGAFVGCTSLQTISLPDTLTSISDYVFSGCSALENITVPSDVKTIGVMVFSDCRALKSITLPVSVTTIGEFAFYGCSSLKDVYYGGTGKQKDAITVGGDNKALIGATWHCSDDVPDDLLTGNLNSDSIIDIADATMLFRAINGRIVLTPEQEAVADVNRDGRIDIADATMLFRFVNGRITTFDK